MAKKPRVRTLMSSQYVKGSKPLLKSAQQYFLSDFSISLKENPLKNFWLSIVWNLETIC